jgi:hypothetical protein
MSTIKTVLVGAGGDRVDYTAERGEQSMHILDRPARRHDVAFKQVLLRAPTACYALETRRGDEEVFLRMPAWRQVDDGQLA